MPASRRTATIASLALIFLLAACGQAGSTASPAATTPAESSEPVSPSEGAQESYFPAPEVATMAVATAKDPQLSSALVVGTEKGLFEPYGITVDLRFFDTGGDIAAAATSGDVQLGVTGDAPAMNLRAGDGPIKVIAQTADISGAQSLWVRPELADDPETSLQGAKIASIRGTTLDLILFNVLDFLGLSESDVEIVALGLPDAVAAFIRGDVDAVATADPFSLSLEEAGATLLARANESFIPGSEGPQKFAGIHALAWAREDFLADNPNAVQAFLRGMIDATTYIADNPEESAELVQAALAEAGREHSVEGIADLMSHNLYQINITQELIDDLETNAEFLVSQDAMSRVVAADEWVDTASLEAIDPSLVTWTP